MQRTNSESSSTGPPPKGWRFGSALRKIGSRTFTSQDKASLYRKPSLGHEIDPHETFHTRPDYASIHESSESSGKQLLLLIQRMRAAPTGASHVDSAYKEFTKIYAQAATLCSAILQEEIKSPISSTAVTETGITHRESSIESPRSHATAFDNRSSFSGRSLGEVITGSGTGRSALHHSDVWLAPIRDWKACLENLTEAFKVSLADTYKSYERDATPEMLESLFASKKFRRDAVARMRNASVTRVLSADPQFFPRYEIRFRNYEKVKTELGNIRQILQGGESGISPSRTVLEFDISPHGDAVLEFANLQPDASPHDPVLRFRVSPHVLAQTSPIFARMFAGRSSSMLVHDIEDITTQLPAPPSRYYCKDGTEAWLYRMPQHEVNRHNAMETLMHAAHMHNNVVPRDVSFDQFVAIAECSIRYKSTSPLELMVEHRWLPQWMHRGADDMPDGLLIISYAFGCRGLFSRMSKSAILNLVDEKDLQSKPWPQKIKDKMWAVRSAKVAQLYECCTSLLQEYLQPPTSVPHIDTEAEPVPAPGWTGFNAGNGPVKPSMSLMSTPRCPKGSHWCDATTMGWLMLVFNNMNLLSPILRSPTVCSKDTNLFPAQSLAQIVDLLRSIPSPQAPVHRGSVCDPIPSFRTAIGDIYNTVIGLTLHDVSGKSHGWALSKNLSSEPQMEEATGLQRMAAHNDDYTVAAEFPESIILRILSEIADLEDLHAAARINRPFYETYKMYELPLMRNILRVGRVRGGSVSHPRIPIISTNAEGKSLTSDLPLLTERSMDERTGSMTGRSAEDDSEASSSSDESSDDEMPEPSPDRDSSDQLPPDYEPVDVSRPGRRQMASDRSSAASSSVSRGSASHGQDSGADQRSDSFSPSRERRSPAFMTGGQNEGQMTEEEARRILWPDDYEDDEQRRLQNQTRTPSTVTIVPSSGVGVREKFRLGDPSFAEGLEDKTLISIEAKQLKKQREQQSSPQGVGDDENEDEAD